MRNWIVTNVLLWSEWERRFRWSGSDEYVHAENVDRDDVEQDLASFIYAGCVAVEAACRR